MLPRFFTLVFALLLGTSTALGETEVCGTLALAQEWTMQGSPYHVTGNIIVPETSQLRIGPGVEVRVASHPQACGEKDSAASSGADTLLIHITLEGAFYCIGEPKQPVVFRPDSGNGVKWEGLRLSGQSKDAVEIAFAEFHGANRALKVENAAFYVHHTLFQENHVGIWLGEQGNLTVLQCDFIRNRIAGLRVEQASPRVVNNIFYRNSAYGIWMGQGGSPTVTYNAFWENGEEHCFRCPYAILRNSRVNANGDTCDALYNLAADPVFVGSESDQAAQQKDLGVDTPEHLVRDPEIARLEKKSRLQFWKHSAKEPPPFVPRGQGEFVLSRYSKLIRAGHPGKLLCNSDGTSGDIGLHGGPDGRITLDPF